MGLCKFAYSTAFQNYLIPLKRSIRSRVRVNHGYKHGYKIKRR